tara:strand:+ start:1152 stop:1658 length:507 start_codon:yes stop_codon:yes gene_type:complete
MLIYNEDTAISRWVQSHIPHAINGFDPCTAIGYADSASKLIAGFVFNDYHATFKTIGISMAATSPMWARREVIHKVLSYPFEQLGVYKLTTFIPADNSKAIAVNVHIGFKQEAILAHQFGKKRHAVVMRLLQPDYLRLFGEMDEQRQTRSPTTYNRSSASHGSSSVRV